MDPRCIIKVRHDKIVYTGYAMISYLWVGRADAAQKHLFRVGNVV